MLLTRSVLDSIVANQVDLVFRRWQKPTVKANGRLRTSVGVLAILSVDIVEPEDVTESEAARAGFCSRQTLIEELYRERKPQTSGRGARSDGPRALYRICLTFDGLDERVALRNDDQLDEATANRIVTKLAAIDARTGGAPWTREVLHLINHWPGRRAPELAELLGKETLAFKADVRKLKALGLTESLSVGYRLSPRGLKVIARLT